MGPCVHWHEVTWRLLCSSLLVMTCFFCYGLNKILPKQELYRSPQVDWGGIVRISKFGAFSRRQIQPSLAAQLHIWYWVGSGLLAKTGNIGIQKQQCMVCVAEFPGFEAWGRVFL